MYMHPCMSIPTCITVCICMHITIHTQRGRDEEGEERGPMSSLWVADKVKSMILTTNSDSQTPLHLAAQNGHDK